MTLFFSANWLWIDLVAGACSTCLTGQFAHAILHPHRNQTELLLRKTQNAHSKVIQIDTTTLQITTDPDNVYFPTRVTVTATKYWYGLIGKFVFSNH